MAVNKRKIRIPFQPLNYSAKHLAQPQELMINFSNGDVFVMGLNGDTEIEFLKGEHVSEYAQTEILKILDGVSETYNTLEKIDIILKDLEEWKEELMTDNDNGFVDSLLEIFKKFQGMSEQDQNIIDSINSKVDKVPGKVLSSNNFTNELKSKLENIDNNANNYTHPKEKVCNLNQDQLLSLNGKTGNVELTYKDIEGLKNIEPDATNYIHPTTQICNYIPRVNRVNNKTGNVVMTKEDIGLNNIVNYPLTDLFDISDYNYTTNSKYATHSIIYSMVYNEIVKSYPPEEFLNVLDPLNFIGIELGISSADFLTHIGLSHKRFGGDGRASFETVRYNGKNLYISKNPIIDISWNELNALSLITGKTFSFGNINYRCRTPKIDDSVHEIIPYYQPFADYYYPKGEIERLFFSRNYTVYEGSFTDIIVDRSKDNLCAVVIPFKTNSSNTDYFTTSRPEGLCNRFKTDKLCWYPVVERI